MLFGLGGAIDCKYSGASRLGAISYDNGTASKFRLVSSKKLSRAIDNGEKIGMPADISMNPTIEAIQKFARSLGIKNIAVAKNHEYQYLAAHGYAQVWDKTAKKSVLDVCEHLANPLKTAFMRLIKK